MVDFAKKLKERKNMTFAPKTDKQLAEENLLPGGEYDYEVMEVTEQFSKSGNEMVKLRLRIFHGESGTRTLTDYLLEAMAGKLKHFCTSHGMQDKYDAGTLCADDCMGLTGRVRIGIKKDKTGQYPDQNTVFDYVVAKGATTTATPSAADDDCPF